MSIPSWAKVGAKVVCINDVWRGRGISKLIAGDVYTIVSVHRQFGTCKMPDGTRSSGHWVVELAEVHNPDDRFHEAKAPGHALARFRPVKTIEDDISEHFAQHLTVRGRAPMEMAS